MTRENHRTTPLRTLRFIAGKGIGDARFAHDGDREISRNWVEPAFPGPSIVICGTRSVIMRAVVDLDG